MHVELWRRRIIVRASFFLRPNCYIIVPDRREREAPTIPQDCFLRSSLYTIHSFRTIHLLARISQTEQRPSFSFLFPKEVRVLPTIYAGTFFRRD